MYRTSFFLLQFFFFGSFDHQVLAIEENAIMDTFSLLNPWHSLRTLVTKSLATPEEVENNGRTTREVADNPDCLALMNNYDTTIECAHRGRTHQLLHGGVSVQRRSRDS